MGVGTVQLKDEAGPDLIELRCPNDGKLLLKVSDIAGVQLEVKCSRCGEVIETKRVDAQN